MRANTIWIGYKALARKELMRVFRIWPQTILPPVITMTLYFLIFGRLVGSQLKPVYGVPYIQFLVPGLVMMPVVLNSYANTSSSFFSSKIMRWIEELLVSPLPNYIILLGFVTGSMARSLVVALCVCITAAFFTHYSIAHFFVVLSILILSAFLFSLAGLLNAIFAKKFDDISIFPTFVLTPLTYLGGVFYSIHQLSPFFRFLSKLNPVYYTVSGLHYGFLGTNSVSLYKIYGILIGMIIVLYVYVLYLLKNSKRLRA